MSDAAQVNMARYVQQLHEQLCLNYRSGSQIIRGLQLLACASILRARVL